MGKMRMGSREINEPLGTACDPQQEVEFKGNIPLRIDMQSGSRSRLSGCIPRSVAQPHVHKLGSYGGHVLVSMFVLLVNYHHSPPSLHILSLSLLITVPI